MKFLTRLQVQETPSRSLTWGLFTLVDAERAHISEVVEMTNGVIEGEGGAAEVLGVPPSILRSRVKKLGMKTASGSSF